MDLEFHQLEKKYAGLRIVEAPHLARLVASLCTHGQQQPVLVVRAGGHGDGVERDVLIDGYARVAALAELERDSVEASVLELTEAQALVLAFRLERHRVRSAIEEAWLLRELIEGHALAQRALAPLLGRSPSWVSRRLALIAALPVVAEEAVRAGRLPAYAAMKYLVPLARANAAQCEQLVTQLGRRRLSVRQLARLYAGWRAGTAAERLDRWTADVEYLRLLHLAASTMESTVETALAGLLEADTCPSAAAVKRVVAPPEPIAVPALAVPAVDLTSHDGLLGGAAGSGQ